MFKTVRIKRDDFLDALYYACDGTETIDAAFDSMYSAFKYEYGKNVSIEYPLITREDANDFYDWCEEVGMRTDRLDLEHLVGEG